MRNDNKECTVRDLRKAGRYLKAILKLEDVLEEQKPFLLSFKVSLIWCMRVAWQT